MANEKLKTIKQLFSEQFPDSIFTFSYSLKMKRWFLFVSDYETYMLKDFKEVTNIIREEVELNFIAVYLKNPKKNNDFLVFI